MKLNQKGFGVIEGLLVIIALTLIVGVGFYVANVNKDKKTDNSNQKSESVSNTKPSPVSNTQKVELQSGGKTLATLEIPKDWETTVAHKSANSGEGQPACSLTATNSLTSLDYGSTTFPGANSTSYGSSYGVVGFDIVKQPNNKSLEQYFTDDLYGGTDPAHSFDKLTINGNPAVAYNGSSDTEYKQQYYLVSHNGYVACVNWRHYNQNSAAPAASYDYSKHLSDVEAIAKSIKFTD